MSRTIRKFDKIKELKRLAREQLGVPGPTKIEIQRKKPKYKVREETEPEFWIKGDGQKEIEQ